MIQGFGASALMAIGPAIMTTAFSDKDRGQALGIVGSVVSAGFLTGPILGGFLVEHMGWRSVFFVNLPIGVIAIFMSSKFLEKKKRTKEVRLDLLGAFLIFCIVTFLLLSLDRLSKGPTLLLLTWFSLTLACFIFFIFSELRSPSPLVDLNVFRRRLFISSLGTSLLSFWMSAAHTFVAPFFLQSILAFSPSKVGILIFPLSLTVMVLAPLGGKVSDRVGARVPATVGLAVISLTMFSFTLLKSPVSDYQIVWRHVVIGIGIALFNPANNSAIIGSLPKEKIGLASSFVALSRNLGMMIGIAFAEMVIAIRIPAPTPSLESIHDVWKLGLLIGLAAILISWIRERGIRTSRE
jgi:EmrB/QacA subfamily drug resistance transporter